jgi:hypothetical protein
MTAPPQTDRRGPSRSASSAQGGPEPAAKPKSRRRRRRKSPGSEPGVIPMNEQVGSAGPEAVEPGPAANHDAGNGAEEIPF